YPLTEEFHGCDPQGWCGTMQYFERAIFEWHPGIAPSRYDVQLGLVGDEVTAGRSTQAPFVATSAKTSPGCAYFAATGHNLCGGFAAYWKQFGGLATYGMPISEEFQERNPDTGQIYTVQYFERARFEWHPGTNPAHYDVELGRLGAAELLAAR
ncbi:MAG TPA: ferritin-like domain-containing protein, partial [Thermomicrobiaceae bacterium]|nr:ferritin-like domain-containing protein [Thermomicrobiaceae bacterium]